MVNENTQDHQDTWRIITDQDLEIYGISLSVFKNIQKYY